jgi:hypothetical protein
MMPVDCPDQPTLENILLGRLAGAEAEKWEEHLAHCPRCPASLGLLDREDALTVGLRRAQPRDGSGQDPIVKDLIGQLRGLLPRTPASDETPTMPLGKAVAETEDFGFLSPPRQAGELGRLGPYGVLKKLGEGGMGLVFEAEDSQLQRRAALKVMLPKLVGDAESRRRFLQEARAAAAIAHERVVTIYQVDEDNGVPFLAMQLLQGETLEARLRRQPGPVPVGVIMRLGREIAEGLEAAHRLGVIHRDVKPGNIWLQADGDHVKVLDFGLARVTHTDARLTQSGMILGTPGFLAPEQAAGRAVDARSDLFSLGVVLYLLATGEMPFRGPDVMALLTALAVAQPRPVFELNPDIPEALDHLIMRLLSKELDTRPRSAREVIDILAALEGNRQLADRPNTHQGQMTAAPAGKPPARSPHSWKLPAILGAALTLGLVCLIMWPPFGRRSDRGSAGNPASDLAEGWLVLFRSDDPALWNTDSPGEQFAIPVQRVPDTVRFVRLTRLDTRERLIVPVTPGQLLGIPRQIPAEGHWWNGTAREEFGARHLGVVQAPRFKWPWHGGTIALQNDGWDVFAGSGFGHKHNGPGKAQYYCWRGQEIPRTVFEIAVTAGPLSEDEHSFLLK